MYCQSGICQCNYVKNIWPYNPVAVLCMEKSVVDWPPTWRWHLTGHRPHAITPHKTVLPPYIKHAPWYFFLAKSIIGLMYQVSRVLKGSSVFVLGLKGLTLCIGSLILHDCFHVASKQNTSHNWPISWLICCRCIWVHFGWLCAWSGRQWGAEIHPTCMCWSYRSHLCLSIPTHCFLIPPPTLCLSILHTMTKHVGNVRQYH